MGGLKKMDRVAPTACIWQNLNVKGNRMHEMAALTTPHPLPIGLKGAPYIPLT
ncbi:uncharacterized protein G2W53_025326 [Senna tora]|uniref:Uncharacterized protein n=1 Tax=Senna tora TaxID=362788 RepID=A0A834TEZ8_9FABA|nr:uncharacterized protein G2W53_025326 [Senna tora]